MTSPLCLAVMIPLPLRPLPQRCRPWINLFRGLDFTCLSTVLLRVLGTGVVASFEPISLKYFMLNDGMSSLPSGLRSNTSILHMFLC
jgi:hypothetical protein